ncbi:MAG: hypothetical protein IJ335_10310 [Lachnospiraceae bacterium]|nr:hypothetical protein [Lachnospiraceae bacterium]
MCTGRRKICLLIALIMLITGMCFDNIKAHSRLVYATLDGSTLTQTQSTVLEQQSRCMPEAAVVRHAPGMRQTLNPTVQLKRDLRFANTILCNLEIALLTPQFFSTEVTVHLRDTVHHRVILNYIHRMDGKKRI